MIADDVSDSTEVVRAYWSPFFTGVMVKNAASNIALFMKTL